MPRPLHPWPMGLSFSLLLAGEEGLEPPTHWLTVSCANQLRYTPKYVVRWEHDSESTMLSAILPILWEVLKIHFSADVPRPRTSLIDGLGTSRRGTLCISFTLLIYYNIFFFENQICYNWLSYQDGFFSIFPNALPVELSPHIRGFATPLVVHLRHLARCWCGEPDLNRQHSGPKQSL